MKTWHFVLCAVLFSEIFTLLLTSLYSFFQTGMLSRELFEVGAIDAIVVSLIVTSMLVPLLRYSTKIKLERTILQNEIVERNRVEATLRESEDKYRRLIETTGTGYVILDDQGRVTDANQDYAYLTGRQKLEDVINHSVLEWTAPHDLERNAVEVRKCVEQGFVRNLEIDYFTPFGKVIPVEINATAFRVSNNLRILSLCRDITDRKQAEEALQESKEQLSQILNSTSEGIYGLDLLGNCTFCNPSGIRILGYHDEKDVIGKDIHQLIHHTKTNGTPYPKDECAAHRAIAKGEYIHRDTEILWRSDGTSFPAEFWTHPILKGIELVGMVVSFIDITKRVALENQLLHAQKMEAVGTLAGGMAHDFNNILSVILGYADILHIKIPVDDPLRTNVEEILRSVESATQLTHSLLAFSKKQLVTVKAVDLIDLISRLGKMLVRIIGEDIQFRTEFRQEALFIKADSGQIEQVVMNLATNARDAMPKGGILKIVTDLAEIDAASCDAHGCELPGEYAIITVSDTGIGMSEETQKRMFDPFFTTKDIGKGTGLGLSMVYGIVRQHNGFVYVDSEQGVGTVFRIYLPAIQAVADEKTEPILAQSVDKGNETILVAEDDHALRKLLQIVLESFGYKVILAEDGQDAVRKFTARDQEIALVILDMMMPKMTGIEAYEAIKNLRPEVKTLFVSGYTADKVTETGLIADGMEIVTKPISPRDLLRTVRRVLDMKP